MIWKGAGLISGISGISGGQSQDTRFAGSLKKRILVSHLLPLKK